MPHNNRVERSFALANRLLAIANRHSSLSPFLEAVVEEFRRFLACSAVGIRIRNESGGIPYEAYFGFCPEFHRLENPLQLHVDSCMCTRVVLGETDPSLPCFTPRGSFYLNDTEAFLNSLSPEQRSRTRNRCHEFGYRSVALVPIRNEAEIFGLVHVADVQVDRLPLETVEILEDVSGHIATSIRRVAGDEALRKTKEVVEAAYVDLEHRVRERTSELSAMNNRLRRAIARHEKTLDILRHSEERFRLAFEEGPLGVVMVHETGAILKVNRRFAEMVGFTENELLCMVFSEMLAEEDRPRFAHTGQAMLAGGRAVNTSDFRFMTRDRRVVHGKMTMSVLRDLDGRVACLLGMVEDTTQRRETEEALRRAERLAAIGTLAAGIAHEVNNPIGAIVLSVEAARLARNRAGDGETVDAALSNIHTAALRCGRIVKNVLQFARAETSRRWAADLSEILAHAHDLTGKFAAEKGVSLILEPVPPLPSVVMNPTEMEQVFVNVMMNAIQASSADRCVVISVMREEAVVHVAVVDQGCGMTPDQLQRIFNPFYTTRVTEGGTGLGLSISHGIVRQHGGRIEVESAPGKGTKVAIILPLATGAPADSARP